MKYLLAILVGLAAVVGVILLAIAMYVGATAPPLEAQNWDNISQIGKKTIRTLVPPLPGETFLYFYGDGFDFTSDGNLVTDQRVVSYEMYEGEFLLSEGHYEDIADLTVEYSDTWLENTIISLHFDQPDDDFAIWISIDGGMDRTIIDYIESRIGDSTTIP